MAQIMGKHWRSRNTSWAKFLWSSISWIAMGNNSKKLHLELGWEKVPHWDCLFVHRTQGLFLSVNVENINIAGKKQNKAPVWKKLVLKVWMLTKPHHCLTMKTWSVLSLHANRKNNYWTVRRRCLNHVFLLEQQKNSGMGKTSRANRSVDIRHGGTCSKMRWDILWTSKQGSGATLQSFKSLLGWSST